MLAALCAGIPPTARLSLFASLASEVEQVRSSRDLPGLADFDHDLRRSARRQRGSRPGTLKLPTGGRVLYVAGAPPALRGCPLPAVWQVGLECVCLNSAEDVWQRLHDPRLREACACPEQPSAIFASRLVQEYASQLLACLACSPPQP